MWAGDAHVRVTTACLQCMQAALAGYGPLLERHLDRLLPPLLLRAADGKEGVRRAAAEVLATMSGMCHLPFHKMSNPIRYCLKRHEQTQQSRR